MKTKKNHDRTVELDIKKLIKEGVNGKIFPCAAAGISVGTGRDKIKIITCYGNASIYPEKRKIKKKTYFDLASLTKPLATSMAILCLVKKNKIDLNEKLPSLLGKKIIGDKKIITLKHLLGHCSGFAAHKEYFKILKDKPFNKRGDFVENLLLSEELEYRPGTKVIYSDLGFILLGIIIEKRSGYSLQEFIKNYVFKPIKLEKKLFFNPLFDQDYKLEKENYAATEKCPWRNKILCGEVHDDNCYALGGVAGHSGLFGNIEGVTTFADFILDMWKGKVSHPYIDNNDLLNFLVRQKNLSGSDRTLGFDTVSKDCSSSGKYFSKQSIGHLGFSGTSLWIDPEKEIVVVLLSNRIHPSRENKKIVKYRPYFHDMVIERVFLN